MPQPPVGGRPYSMRADEVGVVVHGFVVAGVLLRHLGFEAGGLVFGIVQFQIAVGQFAAEPRIIQSAR